jgi:hypothetical protein
VSCTTCSLGEGISRLVQFVASLSQCQDLCLTCSTQALRVRMQLPCRCRARPGNTRWPAPWRARAVPRVWREFWRMCVFFARKEPSKQFICSLDFPGSSCASTGAAPVPCGAGSYSVGSSVDCTVCAPGYACPSTTSAASVVACAPGTYAVGAATACTVCAAGHACPSTVLALQVPCLPGYEMRKPRDCIHSFSMYQTLEFHVR